MKVRRMDVMSNQDRLDMYVSVYNMQKDGKLSSSNAKKLITGFLTEEIDTFCVNDLGKVAIGGRG